MNAWIQRGREGAVDLYRRGDFLITSHYSAFCPQQRTQHKVLTRLMVKHHFILSRLHPSVTSSSPSSSSPLTLPLSFPLPSGAGATAWMRCWVHGNWVGIDWTAAWPTRGQWEPGDQSSTTDCVSHPTFCRKTWTLYHQRQSEKKKKKNRPMLHF